MQHHWTGRRQADTCTVTPPSAADTTAGDISPVADANDQLSGGRGARPSGSTLTDLRRADDR